MLSPLRVLDYSFSFGIDNILASTNERCRLFYELWNLLNSTFYWLFTVANQWLVSVMFVACSPMWNLKLFFLCVCMSICACSHVWVWACAWFIIAHVEVRGQPWVLDLAFSPFVCSCVLPASWVWCAPLSPSSILLYPVLGYRFVLLSPGLHGFWGSKSRVLTLSPSSHFSRPQCSFYWLKKEIMSAGCHSFWKLCWRILLLHLCMCVYSCVNCCGGQRSSSGSCLWRLLPLFWSRAIPMRPESRLSWPRSLRDPPPFTQPWLWDDRYMPPHPAS